MADTYTLFSDIPNFHVNRIAALLWEPNYRNDALLSSRVVTRSAQLDSYASTGAAAFEIPYYNPLQNLEPDVASKDHSVRAEVHGITGSTMRVINNYRSKTFGSARLLSTLNGTDVMGAIARSIADYEADARKSYLGSMLKGVSKAAGAAHTLVSTDVLNLKNILNALQKRGDAKTKFKTIAMNSLQHTYLQLAAVGFKAASETNTGFDQIAGLNIVVTDDLPEDMVVILADGAIQVGEASLGKQRLGFTVDELNSNGWGTEALTPRAQFILHPAGTRFIGEISGQGASPTNADVENANDWQIAVQNPKAFPFIFMKVAITPPDLAPTA